MQLNLNKPFRTQLLMFTRDTVGNVDYSRGLSVTEVEAELNLVSDNWTAQELSSDEWGSVHSSYDNFLFTAARTLKNAVLLDNDDAFFRNMVAPHVFATFKEMFNEQDNMFFTPDVSPPPSRLNFPMLVGHREAALMVDLQDFIGDYLTRGLANQRFQLGREEIQPSPTVTVVTMQVIIDV